MSQTPDLSTTELVTQFESKKIYELALPINSTKISSSKPILIKKNCKQCSKQGFHSWVFDIDWVSKCCVHNQTLEERCPGCHLKWPTSGDLLKRKCQICSANLSTRLLCELSAFKSNLQFPNIDVIRKLSSIDELIYPKKYTLVDAFLKKVKAKTINSNSFFYPSLAITKTNYSFNLEDLFEKYGIPNLAVLSVSFQTKVYTNSSADQAMRERKRLNFLASFRRKIMTVLSNACAENHTLGSCYDTQGARCACCMSWVIWSKVYSIETDTELKEMYHHISIKEATNFFLSQSDFYPQSPPTFLQINEIGNTKLHDLPTGVRNLLYKASLWGNLRRIYEFCYRNTRSPLICTKPAITGQEQHWVKHFAEKTQADLQYDLSPIYITSTDIELTLSVPQTMLKSFL